MNLVILIAVPRLWAVPRCQSTCTSNAVFIHTQQLSNNSTTSGIFSSHFSHSLHFTTLPVSNSLQERCSLHQLSSVIFLLQKHPSFFHSKSTTFFTNFTKYQTESINSIPFLNTTTFLSRKLDCSLYFAEASPSLYQYQYAIRLSQIGKYSTPPFTYNSITLHNGQKHDLLSFLFE